MTETTLLGPDRPVIALLIYFFVRISAALMMIRDYYPQGKKGGKQHEMPVTPPLGR